MQRFCAKVIQGFNKRVRSDKAITMLGLPRIVALIDKFKLFFFRKLCLMPFSSIPRQIFIVRFVQHLLGPSKTKMGFIADIESIGNKYGLTNLMCLSVMEGSVSDFNDWHESILSQIEQHEERSYFDHTSIDA